MNGSSVNKRDGETLLKAVRDAIPDFRRFEEQKIVCPDTKTEVGWHSYLIAKSEVPYSGGTAMTINQARRICVAEAIERVTWERLIKSPLVDEFLVKQHPTTCGFAAGFDKEQTRFRAMCEAVERWTWSRWIDSHQFVPEIQVERSELSPLAQALLAPFDSIRCFTKVLSLKSKSGTIVPLKFGALLGFFEGGVFIGSRVTGLMDDLWTHSAIEARRNYGNFVLYKSGKLILSDEDRCGFYMPRLLFFGDNAEVAIDAIHQARDSNWDEPELILCKEATTGIPNAFVWRALCENYVDWSLGDDSRFVF